MNRGLLGSILLVLTLSCQKNRTEIILEIATNIPIGMASRDLNAVEITICRSDSSDCSAGIQSPLSDTPPQALLFDGGTNADAGAIELPTSYAVYSANGSPDRFTAVVTGFTESGAQLLNQKAVMNLVPQETLSYRMALVTSCIGIPCDDPGTTCIDGMCSSDIVVPTPYTPDGGNEVQCADGDGGFLTGTTHDGSGTCPSGKVCRNGYCSAQTDGGPPISSGTGGTGVTGTGGTGFGGSGGGNGGMGGRGGSTVAGTGGGSGGTSGKGGAGGAALGCRLSDSPASSEIAFVGSDGGIASPLFGTFPYGNNPLPTFTIGGGMVHVTDTIQVAGGPYYQGFGLYLNGNPAGTDCINASSYTGVRFDLSGSLLGTGCTMLFLIGDSEHDDLTLLPPDPKAAGPKGSYPPQLPLTPAQLTSTPQTIMVPFTGAGSPLFTGGYASPNSPVDPTKLVGIQWQLDTPTPVAGGATECDWNINISNVKFY